MEQCRQCLDLGRQSWKAVLTCTADYLNMPEDILPILHTDRLFSTFYVLVGAHIPNVHRKLPHCAPDVTHKIMMEGLAITILCR